MGGSRSFEDLVAEADAAPMEGWDFSWLDGRATEERPSWGYGRLMGEALAAATAALDVETGGGEVLARAPRLPPAMAATESSPPNVERATRLLHPRGVVVVAAGDEPPGSGSSRCAASACGWSSSTSAPSSGSCAR